MQRQIGIRAAFLRAAPAPRPRPRPSASPFADAAAIDDLERVAETGSAPERKAAGLALAASSDRRADDVLRAMPTIERDVAEGRLTWESLAGEI